MRWLTPSLGKLLALGVSIDLEHRVKTSNNGYCYFGVVVTTKKREFDLCAVISKNNTRLPLSEKS